MRLWFVQTGKCLFVWEFPTTVKHVSFSDDDEQIVCITKQRVGRQGAIRIFNVHRDGDGTVRACTPPFLSSYPSLHAEDLEPVVDVPPDREQGDRLRVPIYARSDPDGPRVGQGSAVRCALRRGGAIE
jgi:hypothetical protein